MPESFMLEQISRPSSKSKTMLSLEEANEMLIKTNSFNRMPYLLSDLFPRKGKRYPKLSHEDWLVLIGEEWSSCDRTSQYWEELLEALPHHGPVRLMMTEEENMAHDALPEMVTIYRGCDASRVSVLGPSWTLSKDVANSFPFLGRFRADKPTVLTATVRKGWILAVKLERGEEEIVTFAADVKRSRSADPPPGQTI
jgi:hypothetical protein